MKDFSDFDNQVLKMHEKDILQLKLENRMLRKKICRNIEEIKKLRNNNREILGRK